MSQITVNVFEQPCKYAETLTTKLHDLQYLLTWQTLNSSGSCCYQLARIKETKLSTKELEWIWLFTGVLIMYGRKDRWRIIIKRKFPEAFLFSHSLLQVTRVKSRCAGGAKHFSYVRVGKRISNYAYVNNGANYTSWWWRRTLKIIK